MKSPYLIDILNNKPKRGGAREGAGRKESPPTKILTFRVRLEEENPVRDAVKETINKIRNHEKIENNNL